MVVDFETTILDKGSPYNAENRIVCSSYRLGAEHPDFCGGETRVIIGNEYEQQELIAAIEKADFWVAHNIKFEYGWLERCGLPLEKTLAFCTQLSEYVIRSNRRGGLSLKDCLARRGLGGKIDLGSKLLKAQVCPSTWPRSWLVPYSKRDVDAGEKLFLSQRKFLLAHGKLKTVFTRCIFTPVLVDIERTGMHLDKQRCVTLHKQYTIRLNELQEKIDVMTGGANPNSPLQMREVLYEQLGFKRPTQQKWLTGKGEPTTSFDYIETLKPKNKKQEKFKEIRQEYGKVNAALTKCLNKFADCVNETEDHILTASLNQTITKTQRLSSTGRNYGAQFQNFPRIFKPLFKPRKEGWLIGEIDQAQLEYRVAVWFGQDEAGMYDIAHKIDSHAFTAEKIFGQTFTQLSSDSPQYKSFRTRAKAHTFKPLYGGKSGTKDEVRYYEAFAAKHKGVTKVQEEWKAQAMATDQVRCPSGLTFYFPNTRMDRNGYVSNSTNICNYNVQSLATADIVPIGVTYQWHLMKLAGLESFIVNTIHDSAILEVNPKEIDIISEIGELSQVFVVKEYLDKIYGIDFNIPLEIEAEFNENWSDSQYWRSMYLNEKEETHA